MFEIRESKTIDRLSFVLVMWSPTIISWKTYLVASSANTVAPWHEIALE